MDPCPYLVKYSFDVLKKKTKFLDIFDTNKKCFMKINIESSPQAIWIRNRFHNWIKISTTAANIHLNSESKLSNCI